MRELELLPILTKQVGTVLVTEVSAIASFTKNTLAKVKSSPCPVSTGMVEGTSVVTGCSCGSVHKGLSQPEISISNSCFIT